MKRSFKIKKAIILISVLIGIGILILLSLVLPTKTVCRIRKDVTDIHSIATALKLFSLDTGRFPTAEEGISVLLESYPHENIVGYKESGYLETIPKDKWGNDYQYFTYNHKEKGVVAVVWSFGKDNMPYGDGESEDYYMAVSLNK